MGTGTTHLASQLEDFSLVLLTQAVGCDLQVSQLLGDLCVGAR